MGAPKAAAIVGEWQVDRVEPPALCGELGGQWDGQSCSTSVESERKAVRNIKMALPGDLVENPTIREYLTNLMNNWRNAVCGC